MHGRVLDGDLLRTVALRLHLPRLRLFETGLRLLDIARSRFRSGLFRIHVGRGRFRRGFRLIVLLLADFVFRDQLLVAGEIGLGFDVVGLGISDVGDGGFVVALRARLVRPRAPAMSVAEVDRVVSVLHAVMGTFGLRHRDLGARFVQRGFRLLERRRCNLRGSSSTRSWPAFTWSGYPRRKPL